MNHGKVSAVIIVVLMAIGLSKLAAGDMPVKEGKVFLGKTFFAALYRTPRIKRDSFFEERLNASIMARGLVITTEEKKMFGKGFRIVLKETEAEALGMRIIYHLYADRLNSVEVLSEHRLFEFSGRLVAYTPISTKRDSYILDVILEKGAVVFE